MSRGTLVVIVAVATLVAISLAQASDFAQFEQRAMTRLFILAALDTLIGARLVARGSTRSVAPSQGASRIRSPETPASYPTYHPPAPRPRRRPRIAPTTTKKAERRHKGAAHPKERSTQS